MTSTSNLWLEKVTSLTISNKYTKWYISIISKALDRSATRESANALLGYVEGHHIIPKCFKLGGETDKSNIAFLTAREHFICHWLLTKMFDGDFKRKMCYAMGYLRINNQHQGMRLSSFHYEQSKKIWKSQFPKRIKMPHGHIGKCKSIEHRLKISIARTGIPHTNERKQRISASSIGKIRGPASELRKQRISAALMGHLVSEDTRMKMKLNKRINSRKYNFLCDESIIFTKITFSEFTELTSYKSVNFTFHNKERTHGKYKNYTFYEVV